MYSHWQQRPSAETKSGHAPAEIQPGRAPSSMKNSAWTIAHKATGGSASAPVEMAQGHKSPASKTASASRDADLEKRVEPIEALIRRGDPSAVPAVLDALGEEDWRVRSRAMDAAVNAYVAIPESALIEHAQRDPSADVRFLALAGISARIDPAIPQVEAVDPSTARALAREALSDANESVRWQGQQILDALDTKQARPSSDAPQAEVL